LFKKTLPFQIGIAIVVLVLLAVIFAGPHLAGWALALLEMVEGMGHYGPLAMIGGFVAVCLFSVPGAPLTLGCGFLFGVTKGTVVAAVGSTLGATTAFLIARFGGRRFIRAKVARKIRFRRLDRAARHHGFTIVLLTRMSPVFPFNLLNYVFGLTSVHFRDYLFATLIGVVPVSILYVYVGSLMKTLTQVATGRVEPSALEPWVIVAGLVLTAGVVAGLAAVARRMLERALRAEEKGGGAPAGGQEEVEKEKAEEETPPIRREPGKALREFNLFDHGDGEEDEAASRGKTGGR
jgi:uncharacterized membrane protein YdjX (TVP38/TMEM64 family)